MRNKKNGTAVIFGNFKSVHEINLAHFWKIYYFSNFSLQTLSFVWQNYLLFLLNALWGESLTETLTNELKNTLNSMLAKCLLNPEINFVRARGLTHTMRVCVRETKPINMVWNEKKTEEVPERFVVRRRFTDTALSAHVLTLSLHPLLSSYLVSMWMENFGKNEHWKRKRRERVSYGKLSCFNSCCILFALENIILCLTSLYLPYRLFYIDYCIEVRVMEIPDWTLSIKYYTNTMQTPCVTVR